MPGRVKYRGNIGRIEAIERRLRILERRIPAPPDPAKERRKLFKALSEIDGSGLATWIRRLDTAPTIQLLLVMPLPLLRKMRAAVSRGRWQFWIDDAKGTYVVEALLAAAVSTASTVLRNLDERGEIVVVRDGEQWSPLRKERASAGLERKGRQPPAREFGEFRRANQMVKML